MRLRLTLPTAIAKAVEQLGLFDGHFEPERKIKGRPGYRQEVRTVNPKGAKPHTRRVWVRIKAEDEKKGQQKQAEATPAGPVDSHPDQPDIKRWKIDNPAAERPDDPHAQEWLRDNPTTITASYRGKADVKDLLTLPGARDEHQKITADSERVQKLAANMRENGYDPKAPITVQVMNDGRALLWEGNHRTRAAAAAGLDIVPVEVRYEGGSEQKPNVWKPRPLREREAAEAAPAEAQEEASAAGDGPTTRFHLTPAEARDLRAHVPSLTLDPGAMGSAFLTLPETPEAVQAAADAVQAAIDAIDPEDSPSRHMYEQATMHLARAREEFLSRLPVVHRAVKWRAENATAPGSTHQQRQAAREEHTATIVQAAQKHLRAGKPLVVATRLRITPLSSPDQIRASGTTIEIPQGKKWVGLAGETVDNLARQLDVPPLDLSHLAQAAAAEDAEQEAEDQRKQAEWDAFVAENYDGTDDPRLLDDLEPFDYDKDALMAHQRQSAPPAAHRIPLTDAQVSAIESRMDDGEQIDGLRLDGNALLVDDPDEVWRTLTEMSNAEDEQAERDRKAGETESAGFAGRASRSLTAIAQKVAALIETGPSVGDTKVENGTTYRLNENHRWERVDEPEPEVEDTRYKDVGEKIGGSRKDLAALRVKYTTTSENVDLDDLDVLEADPEAAHEFVTRDRQFGGSRREIGERHRKNGMGAGLAYVADQILRNIPDRPDDTPEARAAFIKAAARIEGMFTAWTQENPKPTEAVDALDTLRQSMIGYEMDAGETQMVQDLRERAKEAREEINNIFRRLYYAHGRRAANKGFWERPEVLAVREAEVEAQKASATLRQHALVRAVTSPNSTRNVLAGLGKKFTDWLGAPIKDIPPEKLEDPKYLYLYVQPGSKPEKSWQQKRDRLNERAHDLGPTRQWQPENGEYAVVEDWSWLTKRGGGKGGGKKRTRPQWERHVPDTIIRKGGEDHTFTDEGFLDAFALRGVEYGNWMTQDDRREHTQAAGEAFLDLSAVLGVEPGDVSLNGRLALAFGARGRGGRAAAHYEREKKAINLTKYSGGGTLAHEWAHALDNILALTSSGGEAHHNSFVTDHKWTPPGMQATPRLREAWRAVGKAITTAPLPPLVKRATPDDYVRYNHGDALPLRLLAAAIRRGEDPQAKIQADVDRRVAEIESEPTSMTYRKHGRYRELARETMQLVDYAARQAGKPIEVIVPQPPERTGDSDYLVTAEEMGPYWKRPHELFARAFEAFVHDELESRGMRNTYLVAGAAESEAAAWGDNLESFKKKHPGRKAAPHPRGDDRKRINDAMRDLVAAIREEEWLAKAADLLDLLYGPVLVSSTRERP